VVLIGILLEASDGEHLVIELLVTCTALEKCLFISFAYF
jgi:hypothetical protein